MGPVRRRGQPVKASRPRRPGRLGRGLLTSALVAVGGSGREVADHGFLARRAGARTGPAPAGPRPVRRRSRRPGAGSRASSQYPRVSRKAAAIASGIAMACAQAAGGGCVGIRPRALPRSALQPRGSRLVRRVEQRGTGRRPDQQRAPVGTTQRGMCWSAAGAVSGSNPAAGSAAASSAAGSRRRGGSGVLADQVMQAVTAAGELCDQVLVVQCGPGRGGQPSGLCRAGRPRRKRRCRGPGAGQAAGTVAPCPVGRSRYRTG